MCNPTHLECITRSFQDKTRTIWTQIWAIAVFFRILFEPSWRFQLKLFEFRIKIVNEISPNWQFMLASKSKCERRKKHQLAICLPLYWTRMTSRRAIQSHSVYLNSAIWMFISISHLTLIWTHTSSPSQAQAKFKHYHRMKFFQSNWDHKEKTSIRFILVSWAEF